jgi:hypothetical protein
MFSSNAFFKSCLAAFAFATFAAKATSDPRGALV